MVQFGEIRGIFADFYKRLDDGMKYNFNPSISIFSRPLLIFDDKGHALAEIELDEVGAAVAFGREFGRYSTLFGGYTRYTGELDITTGNPEIEPFSFDGAELFLDIQFDRLDDRYLPTRGLYSQFKYTKSIDSLGADASFEQVEFTLFGSKTFGLHNLIFGGQFSTSLDNNVPIYAWYTGGGFLNMSGFEPNSLVGPHYGQLMLGYRYQVGKSGFLPGYAGMTVEYGNATFKRKDVFSDGLINGSFYLAYNSPLGPIYLGVGWSEQRSALYFLRLGSVFGPRSLGRR
jgi:NTE family protein